MRPWRGQPRRRRHGKHHGEEDNLANVSCVREGPAKRFMDRRVPALYAPALPSGYTRSARASASETSSSCNRRCVPMASYLHLRLVR